MFLILRNDVWHVFNNDDILTIVVLSILRN